MSQLLTGQPPRHGGNLATIMANFGGSRADWIDCSTGIAPYSYPLPPLPAAVVQHLAHPDANFHAAAAAYYGAAEGLPVAGSQAAIAGLPIVRLQTCGRARVGVLRGAYAEHGWRWQLGGHQVSALAADAIAAAIPTLDVLVLVNPNNPDARSWPSATLLDWAAQLAARGGWLVVDEAFIDAPALAGSQTSLLAAGEQPGLIVLRSVGKFFGLAGLRLGMVYAPAAIRTALAQWLGPWAVSGPALWAAQLAWQDRDWQQAQLARLQADQAWLSQTLQAHGLTVAASHPLLQYCPVSADVIDQWGYALASQKIYARVFNTPDAGASALRFGPVAEADRARFASRLAAARAQIGPADPL
ncbi:aminotransferase class I/II-fold pyridoxal phosphate-dependent enzyme [Chitinibacter sp. ZOR0017]|uniref:aminotransferase class I/II-fold pyridoxal phosphate-dependent enzyme n=1 Tax=Chitinibacter sp. ZOR0017 TaxID=1339254 RepID=UPI000689CC58|nr:aminotransferase class I/II-fold pyridoxal phosphate-dependent enzyme [Chitinibacter sp. ZOR0017]